MEKNHCLEHKLGSSQFVYTLLFWVGLWVLFISLFFVCCFCCCCCVFFVSVFFLLYNFYSACLFCCYCCCCSTVLGFDVLFVSLYFHVLLNFVYYTFKGYKESLKLFMGMISCMYFHLDISCLFPVSLLSYLDNMTSFSLV